MKKFFLSIIMIGTLLVPTLVLGDEGVPTGWTYERTPLGTEITSPVSFEVSVDNIVRFEELLVGCTIANGCKYFITVYQGCYTPVEECYFESERVLISTNHTFVISLPLNTYNDVDIGVEWFEGEVSHHEYLYPFAEGDTGFPIFEIITPPVVGNIITMDEGFAFSTLAYIGGMFTDLSTYLVVLIGLPLAFWIIKSVIDLKKKKGRKFN